MTRFWVVDGTVQAICVTNGTAYLGGIFSYVGPESGGAGVMDLTTAQAERGFPKIEGSVFAAVADGSGGWYIGGSFTNVGSVIRTNLAHILADHSVDPAWTPHPNGLCRALVLSGGQLYVGGAFTRLAGQTRNRIGAVDAVTGAASSWNPNASSVVNVFALDPLGTTLYVGGAFASIGSSNRNRIAALNLSTGFATSWNPDASSVVTTLAPVGNTVYAGGNFTTIGTQPRNRIAALDATVANGMASTWNPNIAGGGVSNLVVGTDVVYVGGSFTTVGGVGRHCLASINLDLTGSLTTWDPNPDTNVNVLILTGTTLYAGGAFTNIGGAERIFLAALDPTNGTPFSWAPAGSDLDQGVPPAVYVMTLSNNVVIAGGSFASIGGAIRKNIAAVDNSSGEATAWDPNASGAVSALAFGTNTVYAGGSFTNIGGQPRNRLAALSATDGQALSWDPDVRGRAGVAVLSLALSSNVLYAGGVNITNVAGTFRTNLFAVTPSGGALTSWNPPALRTATVGSVDSLFVDGGSIIVGGNFASISGQNRTNLAAVGNNGVVEAWSPNPNLGVSNVVVSGSNVYVGGSFTTIGSILRNRIAAVDRTTGVGILTFNPDANGTTPRVSSLVLVGSVLYAGGQFTSIGGAFRTNAAALQLPIGLAAAWQPRCNALVRTMTFAENAMFVGGDFLTVDGKPRSHFAVFDAGPTIQSFTTTAGLFGFQIRSGQGSQIVIQRANDLLNPNWVNISTNPVTGSVISFADPDPISGQRFYRALALP